MIERYFIKQQVKEVLIKRYLLEQFKRALIGKIEIMKTPLGDRIIIYCANPVLIIGRKGINLKKIAEDLKEKFGLENPQIDVKEVENPWLEPLIVAERIALRLARLGSRRFRRIAYSVMEEVLKAGARGVEIVMSGKLPGERGRTWRFKKGFIPKCGELAKNIKEAFYQITLPPGSYGITVKILPPDARAPDEVIIKDIPIEVLKEKLKKEGLLEENIEDEGEGAKGEKH